MERNKNEKSIESANAPHIKVIIQKKEFRVLRIFACLPH